MPLVDGSEHVPRDEQPGSFRGAANPLRQCPGSSGIHRGEGEDTGGVTCALANAVEAEQRTRKRVDAVCKVWEKPRNWFQKKK